MAMRMESNNQLASAAATKARSSKEHHSSAEGQRQQLHCCAVQWQQKLLTAKISEDQRESCFDVLALQQLILEERHFKKWNRQNDREECFL